MGGLSGRAVHEIGGELLRTLIIPLFAAPRPPTTEHLVERAKSRDAGGNDDNI